MLIQCKGIKTEDYYIPPFTLNKGEIVVLYLYNSMHFYDMSMWLKDIFTGKIKHENVIIKDHFSFVEHFIEPKWRRIFYPVTVHEYLKKNAYKSDSLSRKIYEIDWITKKTRVNTLAGNPRKLLSLYSTLSKTKNIIFDLVAQDPQGAKETYDFVKENIKGGGAAILFDGYDEFKNDCTKFIELEWTTKKLPLDTTQFVLKK